MRKPWFAAWTAAGLVAGCWAAVSVCAPASAADPVTYGPVPAQPTWTQRVKATLTTNPFAAKNGPAGTASAPPQRQQLDPISLSFNSGPVTPQLYVSMADLSCRGGNLEQGRQLYQKALSMEPKNLEALLGAARMEDRSGRLDVASDLYHRAATFHPQNTTVLNDLALCLARRSQLQPARQVLEQAVQLEPRKALYRNNVAKVLVEMNEKDAALAHLSAVHAPAVAHYNMGVLLRDRGRNAEAASYLSAAVAIDPQMESARVLLGQLTPPAPAPVAAARQQAPGLHIARAQPMISTQPTQPVQTPISGATSPAVVSNPFIQTPAAPITPTPGAAPQYSVPMPSDQQPVLLPPVN